MAISTDDQTKLLKVVAGLFNAAPGGTFLPDLESFIDNGGTQLNLARELAATTIFTDTMTGLDTAGKAAKLASNFGLTADNVADSAATQAIDFFTAGIDAGTNVGDLVYEAVMFLSDNPPAEFAEIAQLLDNKAAVAADYSAAKGSTDLSVLQTAFTGVTGAAALTQAEIDAFVAAAGGDPIVVPGGFTLTAAASSVTEGEGLTYTVTASEAVAADTVVEFTVMPAGAGADQGTADTNANDFIEGTLNPTSVTILAGQTTATFGVTASNDGLTESVETYSVKAVVGGETVGTVTTNLLDGQSVKTFPLTTAADTITGTSGNDAIVGVVDSVTGTANTYGAADTIDGGAGTDTLAITVANGTGALPAADTTNVEKVSVRNVDASGPNNAVTLATTGFLGATEFISDRSTGAVTFNTLGADTAVTMKGNGVVANAALAGNYAAGATAGTVNVMNGAGTLAAPAGTITLTGTGHTSTNINSTGAANFTGAITEAASSLTTTIHATSDLTASLAGTGTTKLVATGSAVIDTDGAALGNQLVTVDASAMTGGGLKVAAGTSAAFAFTGGAGDDQVTTGAVLAAATVDAGEGTADRLEVGTTAHITATTGAYYKNFEQVQVDDGVTVDVSQLAANNTIDSVFINNTAGTAGATNLTAAQAGNVSVISAAAGVITLGVANASAGGQIDTVKAALTTTTALGAAQAINLTGLTLTGVEKLELTGNGTAAATTGAVTLTTAAATSLDSIILSNAGVNSVTIAGGQSATNLVVNAAGSTGSTSIDASAYATATGAQLTGGSSFDMIQGSANSDTIVGGAGNDLLGGTAVGGGVLGTATAIGSATSVAASTNADIYTGGEGKDMFAIGINSTVGNFSKITDLDLGGTTLLTGVDGITLDQTTPGAATIVTLSEAQQTTVTGTADLGTALGAVAAIAAAANNVAQFTYGGKTYLFANDDGNATYDAGADTFVEITGVTGTLDATDITIL